jgi:hypothetical protein
MIPALMIIIAAIGAIGGAIIWHSILAAIAPHTIILSIIAIVLLVPLIILAVISVISPEFIALLARS